MNQVATKLAYRCDGLEIDPHTGYLRRDGRQINLRPRSLQVFVYLIEQRARLVTKEELIERLWKGTAVTDDALVQCIVEIRRALGDNSHRPRFIKTFPKVGYHFIGPVEEIHASGVNVHGVDGAAAGLEISRQVDKGTEGGEESQVTERRAEVIAPRPLPPSRSASFLHSLARRRAALFAALTVVIAATGIVFYLSRNARQSAVEVTLPQVPGKRTVAVMYFENQAGDRELDWLREGLADMLITNLSRSSKLTVLSRQQLHLLIERAGHKQPEPVRLDEALDVARRTRAEAVILGGFASLGGKVRVDARLHSARDGQLLAAESVVADRADQILSQVDLLSLKLASHLGATPADEDRHNRLADVMTDNLEAYRCYSLGREKAQAYHTSEALELFERAVALDPQFAMAWARIGYTYSMRRVNEGEKGKPYLEKAFRLADRLSEKDRLYIASWYANANGDREATIKALRELTNQFPLEVEAYWQLGYLLGEDEAEEKVAVYKRGIAADPDEPNLHNDLGLCLCYLGRYEEALTSLQRYVQLAPQEPNAYDSLGMCFNEAGRYDEALAAFNHALALNAKFHFANLHLGNVYFRLGRYREAIRQYRSYIEYAPSNWDRAQGYYNLVLLYLKKGDLREAEAAARREREYDKTFGGPLLVALTRGDLEAAARLKQELFAQPSVRPNSETKNLLFLRGYEALKRGRGDEAIEYFRRVTRKPLQVWNVDGRASCLADAYLELNRVDEAIAEYGRLLATHPNWPPALYGAVRAYERKGERERARAAYERVMQVWQDADADLPEVLTARSKLGLQP